MAERWREVAPVGMNDHQPQKNKYTGAYLVFPPQRMIMSHIQTSPARPGRNFCRKAPALDFYFGCVWCQLLSI